MSFEPIWDSAIACYLFLAGLGGGAFVASALLRWIHPEAMGMRRAGRFIAPIVVAVGLVLLMVDAKAGFLNPARFALLLTNFGSVMTWGVVFLGGFMVVALIAAIMDLREHEVPEWLDIVGVALALCVAVYTGALLGVCKTFPLWNNALLPILFFVSAMSTGIASVLLMGALKHPEEFNEIGALKRIHFCLPVIEVVLVASLLFITSSNSVAGFNSVSGLMSGDHAIMFWVGFVAIGLVAPAAVDTKLLFFSTKELEDGSGGHIASIIASAGTLVGGFLLRYLVLVAALPMTIVAAAV